LKPGSTLNAVVCSPQRFAGRRSLRLVAVWVFAIYLLVDLAGIADARPRRSKNRKRPAKAAKVPKEPKAPAPDAAPATLTPSAAPAASDPAPASSDKPARGDGKAKVFDFTGLDISGRLRAPQLLYFLERANEELERASLERRSFIPEMMRTLDEDEL
jgi:hypothetical protein